MTMNRVETRQLAALELGLLTRSGALDAASWDNASVRDSGTPIHDLNGEVLFRRVAIGHGDGRPGYVDIAVHDGLGGPVLAAAAGVEWNEERLLREAQAAAGARLKGKKATQLRFVAYSFPKIAVQFLHGSEEVLLLELFTWKPVPASPQKKRARLQPSNFERWSLLGELPAKRLESNASQMRKRMAGWEKALSGRTARALPQERVSMLLIEKLIPKIKLQLFERWELHYSHRAADHSTCYEVRGQETNVWCVGASTQMLLDFYRYEYTQTRLADELGLGTASNPNGLPYSRVGDVVTVVEAMSSNALDCTMITNPVWSDFRDELRENRPMISFIPGHSRTVAGYTRTLLNLPWLTPYRGLLVYDPWPPNSGVITRWENFDTQTYQYAYRAQLTLA